MLSRWFQLNNPLHSSNPLLNSLSTSHALSKDKLSYESFVQVDQVI